VRDGAGRNLCRAGLILVREKMPAGACPDAGAGAGSYHEALGLFIEEFAKTEGFMHLLLWHYAGVNPGVGKAVFSGTRTAQTVDLIRRIMSANDPGEPRKSDLEAVFKQLSSINEVRNGLVHYITLSGIPGDVRHLTNAMRALGKKHRREIAVSATVLADMTDDLQKIQSHIWYDLSFDRMRQFERAMLDELRRAPWRYAAPHRHPST
jgi:hypothetical protein